MPMGGTPVTLVPDGTSGVTSAGIVTVGQLPAAAVGADATANPTTSQVFSANELFNGTTWDRQRAALGTTGIPAINTEGTKATYSAGLIVIPASAATDVFTITGSASKIIRVTRIQISGQATATSPAGFLLIKRSAANTGGTSTAPTIVPHDSANAVATATLLNYSVNPSGLGTTVGTVRQQQLTLVAASTPAVPNTPLIWDFTNRNGQGLVLRGIAQVAAINYGAGTIAGNTVFVDIEWTEE